MKIFDFIGDICRSDIVVFFTTLAAIATHNDLRLRIGINHVESECVATLRE